MTMIERVAKAIYETEPYGTTISGPEVSWTDVHESQKEGFRIKAIAAIEAMRDPTEVMKKAGALCEPFIIPDGEKFTPGQIIANSCYSAMIDAALAAPIGDA